MEGGPEKVLWTPNVKFYSDWYNQYLFLRFYVTTFILSRTESFPPVCSEGHELKLSPSTHTVKHNQVRGQQYVLMNSDTLTTSLLN